MRKLIKDFFTKINDIFQKEVKIRSYYEHTNTLSQEIMYSGNNIVTAVIDGKTVQVVVRIVNDVFTIVDA